MTPVAPSGRAGCSVVAIRDVPSRGACAAGTEVDGTGHLPYSAARFAINSGLYAITLFHTDLAARAILPDPWSDALNEVARASDLLTSPGKMIASSPSNPLQ